MKILHIITSLGSGGAEGMLYRLIKSSKDTINHSVICINNGGKYVALLRNEGIDVLVLNFRFISLIALLIEVFKFSFDKKKQGYKIINSWLIHADLFGWFIKTLCGFQGLVWNIRNSKLQIGRQSVKHWLIFKLLGILSNLNVDRIISNSNASREIHIDLGYKRDNFLVIYNGYFINTKKKFIKKFKKYEGIFRLCIVARWNPQKDFENLFKALNLLRESKIIFHLTIAGSQTDTSNKELSNLLKRYRLNKFCTLVGEVNNVDDIYNKSHYSILSSSYGESFPNVLAESMLNFTPCISTDLGDTSIILENVGQIVPIEDHKALAEAMKEGLRILKYEEDTYYKNCLNSFKKVCLNYDIKDISRNYINVWKSLI